MKRVLGYILPLLMVAVFSGCSVLQAVALKDCTYSYTKVSDVTFLDMDKRDLLSVTGIARVTRALLGKTEQVPLGFTVHLRVSNPNRKTASVDKVFYTVFLDSIQIADGCSTEPLIVAGESSVDLPLVLSMDLKTLLSSRSFPSLGNLVKNFLGMGSEATKVTIRLKPVVRVGSVAMSIPRPIPITFEYGGED